MDIDGQACRREIRRLWEKYGLCVLLRSLADEVYVDVRQIEVTGLRPVEVEHKDTLVNTVRNVAEYLEDELRR